MNPAHAGVQSPSYVLCIHNQTVGNTLDIFSCDCVIECRFSHKHTVRDLLDIFSCDCVIECRFRDALSRFGKDYLTWRTCSMWSHHVQLAGALHGATVRQGRTLVHFPAQPEPFLTQTSAYTTPDIP